MHSSGGDIDTKFGADRHNTREHTEGDFETMEQMDTNRPMLSGKNKAKAELNTSGRNKSSKTKS